MPQTQYLLHCLCKNCCRRALPARQQASHHTCGRELSVRQQSNFKEEAVPATMCTCRQERSALIPSFICCIVCNALLLQEGVHRHVNRRFIICRRDSFVFQHGLSREGNAQRCGIHRSAPPPKLHSFPCRLLRCLTNFAAGGRLQAHQQASYHTRGGLEIDTAAAL